MVTEQVRDGWLQDGWARGAFIKVEENTCFFEQLPSIAQDKVKSGEDVYLFPILNDCALVNPCFKTEPWVYAMICWQSDTQQKDFLFAKNPRKYHFPISIGGEDKLFEVIASNLMTLDRELMFTYAPIKNMSWPDYGLDRMLNWVSERFRTPTFPDNWNSRLSTKDKQLKKLWKTDSFEQCSGVYIRIEPFEELPADKSYDVWVYFCLPAEMSTKEYRKFQQEGGPVLRERLNATLSNIQNINVKEIDWISENDFTKRDERVYKRWVLEYFSYSSSDEAETPPEFSIHMA